MHIPGYLEGFRPPLTTSPLVDATGWVDDELFWPAFLLRVGMARSAPEAFGADLADLDVYVDDFDRPDEWPVFTVPIGGGTMHLVVCNLPDDSGITWLLDAEAQAGVRRLAAEDAGPGLPWALLPLEPVHLLTALPAVGDHEAPDGVPGLVAEALRAVGATAMVEELAEELLRHRACVLL
ncbi:hypothetical protein ACFPIJ_63870 [Dactylosporangium cerinum]|uniref:Uncharacterized protein n=1 Tax=Dactylosporangium cerinum TaxID=1434730 RepID=A0ABV9WNS6_9ACTN